VKSTPFSEKYKFFFNLISLSAARPALYVEKSSPFRSLPVEIRASAWYLTEGYNKQGKFKRKLAGM